MHREFQILNDPAMQALGASLATASQQHTCLCYLSGDLGAGKTTLIRGFLHALGHPGAVKSPTYTLLEEYTLAGQRYIHMDLYRLSDAEELEYLGLRDWLAAGISWLVEWPEQGAGFLPPADIHIEIIYEGEERRVVMRSLSAGGAAILAHHALDPTLLGQP